MINIQIATDGKEVFDKVNINNPTLKECALVVYYLEKYIQDLIDREFESKAEVREGDFADE